MITIINNYLCRNYERKIAVEVDIRSGVDLTIPTDLAIGEGAMRCPSSFHGNMLRTAALGVLLTGWAQAQTPEPLVVHEWGTFTALQNENGQALGGINIDDEPLPRFVHNLNPYILGSSSLRYSMFMKGAPPRHPYVTMRLETPVIYFYRGGSGDPQSRPAQPMNVDVKVSMRGGWLSEFYPKADVDAPGVRAGNFKFGAITPDTVGTLAWKNLQIGTAGAGPKTAEHVWTAPRKVNSLGVTATNGESERYLFYRGIGNFSAPLHVRYSHQTNRLTVHAGLDELLHNAASLPIESLWLIQVREDGMVAFRDLPPGLATNDRDRIVSEGRTDFADTDYRPDNLTRLRGAMHEQLVRLGLYEDEATAMLATWQRAYFQSPGLRLFFLVPRPWTDRRLPLEISQPAEITRVMVGRIELISRQQRDLLAKLSGMELSKADWLNRASRSPNASALLAGRSNFGDLGVPVPADFQVYLKLGRFRNALLIAEERRTGNKTLTKFINQYNLGPFRIPAETAKPPSGGA